MEAVAVVLFKPAMVWVVPLRSKRPHWPAAFTQFITTPAPNCSLPPMRKLACPPVALPN